MNQRIGVLVAILSSACGGMAVAVTRFIVGTLDPVTIGAFRYGLGFLFLLPVACAMRSRWPAPRDWAGVVALGLLFYGLFPMLYGASLAATTAAHGALALATLPLLTMLAGAALGIERLSVRKTVGVFAAMAGVAAALATGLGSAPPGAWRGDALMIVGAFCMALYNVWSRPFITRSGLLSYTASGMGAGAIVLVAIAWWRGGFAPIARFDSGQWFAVLYLGLVGGAIAFLLWAFALARTTPTRVAATMTVNPLMAALLATVLVGEPIGLNPVLGLMAILGGIWIASSERLAPLRV